QLYIKRPPWAYIPSVSKYPWVEELKSPY
ncbi:uncharacterized protein METZ01_LOCUS493670, partial [marine metagenome]